MFNKIVANPSANISSRLTKANRSVKLTNKYLVTYDSLSSYWSFCSLRTIYPFSNITRGFAQNGHANILTRPSSLKSRRVQTKTNISGEKKIFPTTLINKTNNCCRCHVFSLVNLSRYAKRIICHHLCLITSIKVTKFCQGVTFEEVSFAA